MIFVVHRLWRIADIDMYMLVSHIIYIYTTGALDLTYQCLTDLPLCTENILNVLLLGVQFEQKYW